MDFPALAPSAPPFLDMEAVTEDEAMVRTAGLLQKGGKVIDFPGFVSAVLDRQKIQPPVLGNGVALPHARTSLVSELVWGVSRCSQPVAFGPENIPVRLVFLFGIPPHRIAEYLALTAALVKRLRNPEVVAGLLEAETPDEFLLRLA